MTRQTGRDNAGVPFLPCDDPACATNACLEHGGCDGEHTYEQHHDPSEHLGPGPCLCPGEGWLPSESPQEA